MKMKSDYVCLNSKTFEIDDRKDIIPVDEQLSKAISTLNKKGYYTEVCYRAKISKPFYRSVMLQELIEEKLLDINDDTKDLIKKIIKQSDYESTLIVFKEEYKFNSLPNGYKLLGRELMYNLSILIEGEDITFKSLVDLDHESDKSIKDLEEWANDLHENV